MDIDKQLAIIKRGCVDLISEHELRTKLEGCAKTKRPLVVKAGFDPTAPDIHLGHTVLLRKMRQFQELGHQVIFLIGDFTARIGDPTGRSEKRKPLTKEEIVRNASTYKKQVSKILDLKRLKIVFNSAWFEKLTVVGFLELTQQATVSQILAREDFKKRLSRQEDISLLEFMYPLLQGYDSVVLKADVELGGTDQIFNLLIGRDIQKDFSLLPQVVLTMPLLEGIDGVQKMSKTFGNFIGIHEAPQEMFGKIMSISDELMLKYYELLTDEDIQAVKEQHPRQAKMNLAKLIIAQYHGEKEARLAAEEFERVFSQKQVPQEIPSYLLGSGKKNILDILVESGLAASKNEARRLIAQGGVYLGSERIDKEEALIEREGILKVGKRRFLKLVKSKEAKQCPGD
ncbi:MAG: tyrosine--tRNA ligase [Candidatus Omnitrophota bacterium]